LADHFRKLAAYSGGANAALSDGSFDEEFYPPAARRIGPSTPFTISLRIRSAVTWLRIVANRY
jgi:hypothetical protein